jgi:hypothetical protein
MHRGRPKKQKEEQEEAPAVLPRSNKFLRALREDIVRVRSVKRQLDMDNLSVEDVTILWHVETPESAAGGSAQPRVIPIYKAASDRYRVEVDRELRPIRFSVAV